MRVSGRRFDVYTVLLYIPNCLDGRVLVISLVYLPTLFSYCLVGMGNLDRSS